MATQIDLAESLIERPQCALCGSSERKIHMNFRDIQVVRCLNCGFLYSNRVLSDQAMLAYYQRGFGGRRHIEGQKVNARTNSVVLNQFIKAKTPKTWLDVGCGYGFLVQCLIGMGIKAEGVELSRQEAEFARNANVPVHNTFLAESGLQKDYFDVVSSFEVIEHMSDPKAFLTAKAEYAKPGGYVIVMTDNFESAAVRQLQAGFPKWIPHTHISHFSPKTLRNCIASIPDLEIVKEAAYTPWDVVGRRLLAPFSSRPEPEQSFDLRAVLSTEMQKSYRLFRLRYLLNPTWTSLTLAESLQEGALMYAFCQKRK